MKTILTLVCTLLCPAGGIGWADTVEVNGIVSLFGQNTAFLVLHPTAREKSVSFALSEGDTRYGVKLLAVDVARHRVKIEHSGAVACLRLGSAPGSLRWTMDSASSDGFPGERNLTAGQQSGLESFLNGHSAEEIRSGQPAAALLPGGSALLGNGKPEGSSQNAGGGPATGTGASGGSNGSGDSSSAGAATPAPSPSGSEQPGGDASPPSPGSAGGSDAGLNTDYTKQYWYITSQNIERTRLATAKNVLSGDMLPLPRTPLTPADTPAALIGSDTYFPTHIQGFVDQSSPDI